MNCALDCFLDSELLQILEGEASIGDCDFTNRKGVMVFEVENQIVTQLEGVISIYETKEYLPRKYPAKNLDLLANILLNEWNIFNKEKVDKEIVQAIITNICSEKYEKVPELFTEKVGLKIIADQEFVARNELFKGETWEDFVHEIKRTNRFHLEKINKEVLIDFIEQAKRDMKGVFYRGRLNPKTEKFTTMDMMSPPPERATAGRANPEGISYLYLADSEETVIHEIRTALLDFVSIAKFTAKESLSIVDLTLFDKTSPFFAKEPNYEKYIINLKHINTIAKEVAKPLRRHESLLDYLPTQYIIEFIKKLGYKGIKYKSSMHEGGFNYAIFDKDDFIVSDINIYEINGIKYKYKKINDKEIEY